jgi:hypothetical protein
MPPGFPFFSFVLRGISIAEDTTAHRKKARYTRNRQHIMDKREEDRG